MTLRALLGLFGLNAFVLVVGIGVLVGIRGRCRVLDLVRLAGVAYLLGVSALMIVLTTELVLGIPFGVASILVTGAVIAGVGLVLGRRRPATNDVADAPRSGIAGLAVAGAALVGITVYLQSLFRAGRLADLGLDVWASWVPKAKSLYYTGGIDVEVFQGLPGPSYPPGIPALNAAALHAMGSADAVTLHLQYWFLAVGFTAAVAGLLVQRVRSVILFPVLALAVLMPDVRNRATDLYGDIPLGYLIALAALLVLLWICDGRPWLLATATVLLGGAMLTKREGILFALCIVVAAAAATLGERRTAWPRLALAGGIAFALALPWRVWFTLEGIPGDAPEGGYLGVFDDVDRAWPSLELVLGTTFDYDLWLLVPALGLVGAALAYLAGARKEATFAVVLLATSLLGCAWTLWSNPSLQIGTEEGLVNRVLGTPLLALAVLTPLLLERAWRGSSEARAPVAPQLRRPGVRRAAAVGAVLGALAIYPAVTLAGGRPAFPDVEDCVVAPVEGEKLRVVFGYRDTFPEAIELRDRALEVGFLGTEAVQDGCGRVRVSVGEVPSVAVGQEIVENARGVGLDPTLESDADR